MQSVIMEYKISVCIAFYIMLYFALNYFYKLQSFIYGYDFVWYNLTQLAKILLIFANGFK